MVDLVSDYYEHDIIRPAAIHHGLDHMLSDDGNGFEYHYNFIDYYFEEDGVTFSARHYLDQPGEISVNDSNLDDLKTDFTQKALAFLGMRYSVIFYPSDEGYEPLPDDFQRSLAERIVAHMKSLR